MRTFRHVVSRLSAERSDQMPGHTTWSIWEGHILASKRKDNYQPSTRWDGRIIVSYDPSPVHPHHSPRVFGLGDPTWRRMSGGLYRVAAMVDITAGAPRPLCRLCYAWNRTKGGQSKPQRSKFVRAAGGTRIFVNPGGNPSPSTREPRSRSSLEVAQRRASCNGAAVLT